MKGCFHDRSTSPSQQDLIEIEVFKAYLTDRKKVEDGLMKQSEFDHEWHDYEYPEDIVGGVN